MTVGELLDNTLLLRSPHKLLYIDDCKLRNTPLLRSPHKLLYITTVS